MPVWHASIAYLDTVNRRTKTLAECGGTRAHLRRALKILGKVGNAKVEYEEAGNLAIHLRRQLTSDEIAIARQARPDAAVFKFIKGES